MSFSQNILVILEDSWDPESQPSSAVQQQTFVISQLAVLCWRGVWITAWKGTLPGDLVKYQIEGYRW